MNHITQISPDPEISVRRKAVFLLNTLILPTTPDVTTTQHDPPLLIASQPTITTPPAATGTGMVPAIAGVSTTSAIVHMPPAPATTSLHTVDEPNANNSNPVHANSHAAHLKDPSRRDTSRASLEAFERYDMIGAVISAVVHPLPFGEDGDSDEPDAEFGEKSMQ